MTINEDKIMVFFSLSILRFIIISRFKTRDVPVVLSISVVSRKHLFVVDRFYKVMGIFGLIC
jgi:hypothetical protein